MTQTAEFYFHGDGAVYTGASQFLHGATCYEFRFIEGHRKGETGWTYTAPTTKPAPRVVAECWTCCGHTQHDESNITCQYKRTVPRLLSLGASAVCRAAGHDVREMRS